ncbi:bifunctional 4-hydroxy-2-oxoglutarate aldolase/2-dehydro-3-deoxy-phosphogluconate aldolase [Microbacterium sp. SL75]|uniref:bifunctional 4-hydroxy-2-oxoglutarate aldolase/2-dehydro-3-deoxy-phosphogluconate aldolase n=1 Tax=Microbacterium sp. SL75 TaxID=2995140 RepID=UPI00226FCA47|nr:bifunctional 4-hydroxy-2-oxoglutarate aldolase/2-dehydro-3-deoxy-phosphogluconate aldolase [Microbacterium sp. SL75]WAC70299.1 bifunctional 4-hydroxy-2-oxoglutarate aldolase/2-dehydro-3-deoxy-phosphogluconate aldolase [Microbacterium sp. SL75]
MTLTLDGVGIVPVLTAPTVSAAVAAGRALARGGITCVEMTLRTAAGLEAIAALSRETDLLVGAGTVLSRSQVEAVAAAGARFVVSPGFDQDVVDATRAAGMASLPGVATATEIQRAVAAGIDTLKFFPADRLGGLATIRALAAPFTGVRFVPSGGVGDGNAAEYLAHPAIAAVSGSWIVPNDAVAAEDVDRIESLTAAAVAALVASGLPAPRRIA